MRDWLEDIIDQTALAEVLAASPVSCGPRFGLIAVDNAIEFMLIAYVEVKQRLVGGHIAGGISSKDWETKKQRFGDLISYVVSKEPKLGALESTIRAYHDLRNDLYHTGKPHSVREERVNKYTDIARQCLEILFSISFTATEWEEHVRQVARALCGEGRPAEARRNIKFDVENDLVKVFSLIDVGIRHAIMLVLQGYSTKKGVQPSTDWLRQSLARSGQPILLKSLNNRIYDLRQDGMIRKDALVLTANGQKELKKHFALES